MKKNIVIYLFLVCCIFSCSSIEQRGVVTVAYSPSFSPAPVQSEAIQIEGFTRDIVQAISKSESLRINLVSTGSEDLMYGLNHKDFQGIITTEIPLGDGQKKYALSGPFLLVGPVLVVEESSSISSLNEMNYKVVGVLPNSSGVYTIEKYPLVLMRNFETEALALQALLEGEIEAVVMGAVDAYQYCHNIYQREIKIVGPPLNNSGLRLIALRNENRELIMKFNEGFKNIQEKGIYDALLKKWNLFPCASKAE